MILTVFSVVTQGVSFAFEVDVFFDDYQDGKFRADFAPLLWIYLVIFGCLILKVGSSLEVVR